MTLTCAGTYTFEGKSKGTPAAALTAGFSFRFDRQAPMSIKDTSVAATVPGRLHLDLGHRFLYLGDADTGHGVGLAIPTPGRGSKISWHTGSGSGCATTCPDPLARNRGRARRHAEARRPVAPAELPQSSNGSRTRIVSSRSGLVDSSATGQSISSSIVLTYFTACAGNSLQLLAPRVDCVQPSKI